jgi:hypothetical protein
MTDVSGAGLRRPIFTGQEAGRARTSPILSLLSIGSECRAIGGSALAKPTGIGSRRPSFRHFQEAIMTEEFRK